MKRLYDEENEVRGYQEGKYYLMKHYSYGNHYDWIINTTGQSFYYNYEFSEALDEGEIIICSSYKDGKTKIQELAAAEKEEIELSEKVKEYWATKEVVKNYKIKLEKNNNNHILSILWKNGDEYAKFKIVEEEFFEGEVNYFVYEDEDLINDEMDFTDDLNDCIKSCIYRFYNCY